MLRRGGFPALPHVRRPDQLVMDHRPTNLVSKSSTPTQWIVQLPGTGAAKSSGFIKLFPTRWDIAAAEGNRMVNANPAITRRIRETLLAACPEVTVPLSSADIVPQPGTAAAAAPPLKAGVSSLIPYLIDGE